MTGRPDSFMPFYIGDYMRDTLRLSTLHHGAYLLLLCAYWADGGPLGDDDESLAAITRLSMADWKRARAVLGKLPFFDVRDGRWHQKRADEEIAKAVASYERRRAAGEKGNAKRNANGAPGDTQSHPNRRRNASRNADSNASTLRTQPEPEPQDIGPHRPMSRGSGAAHVSNAAPPTTRDEWWQWLENDKWRTFREKIGEKHFDAQFGNCRPNGSPTTLLTPGGFTRDQLRARFQADLDEHFGARVVIEFEPAKWNPAGLTPMG